MISPDFNISDSAQEQARFLQFLLDAIPHPVFYKNNQGVFLGCNQAYEKFSGMPRESIVGKTVYDLYPNDTADAYTQMDKELLDHPGLQVYELESGTNCIVTKTLFTNTDGTPLGIIGVLTDITDQRRAEELLKMSDAYFHSLTESSQDCIAHISLEGVLLDMNDAGLQLNGFDSPAEIASLHLTEMIFSDRAAVEDAIRKAGSGETVSIRYMSQDKKGNSIWWDTKLTPVSDFDHTVRSILVVSRDITEQKRAEDAVAQKNSELEKAYAELKAAQSQILQQEKMASVGQLAAGVAHEINNPMGFIISNINTFRKYMVRIWEYTDALTCIINDQAKLSGSALPASVGEKKRALKIDFIAEDIESLINESLDGADRVKKIVQDLKGFSRIDEAEYKPADINAGIESTINIVWNELKYKANLVRDYGDIPLTKCNPGQLNQVFMNLLMNASQALPDRGEIKLKTWHESGIIFIQISDTGCGMTPEVQKRIFEPFYTTKDVGKGTGLGLSIAYDIIKKHSGEINVSSTVGKGTTFSISIPIVEA
jgi:PAS domain S-box-containing protein